MGTLERIRSEMTWLSLLKSKAMRCLALSGLLLAGLGMYGARKRSQGAQDAHQEIKTQTKKVRDEFDEIDNDIRSGSPFDRLRDKRNNSDGLPPS